MGSGPGRFNLFTLFLLAGLAGGGYWLWKFGPVYLAAWQIDHVLADAAAQTYQFSVLSEANRSTSQQELERTTREKVVELGVTDPEMTATIEVSGNVATARCDYTVVVPHILVKRSTVLTMHRVATADIKRVKW